jgi:hypothetical protein
MSLLFMVIFPLLDVSSGGEVPVGRRRPVGSSPGSGIGQLMYVAAKLEYFRQLAAVAWHARNSGLALARRACFL